MGEIKIRPSNPAEPNPEPDPNQPAANPFEGKSPEEIQAMFQAEQAAKAAAEEEAKKMNEAYTNLAVTALQSNQQPAPRPEPPKETPLPDPDEDPAAYQQALIDRRVAEQVRAQVEPLVQIYQQDRPVTLQSAVDNQRLQLRNDARFPGFTEMENDILQFAAQYPLEQRAKPGALEQCYYRVMGQKAATERAAAAQRQSAAMEGGGRSPSHIEQSPADRSMEQLAPVEQKGVMIGGFKNPKEYNAFQGPGRMTIDEFQAAKAEAEAKKGAP